MGLLARLRSVLRVGPHLGLVALGLVLPACGTLAGGGGGASDLPVSGAGPYVRHDGAVLADDADQLDAPQALVVDGRLLCYYTRRAPDGHTRIERAALLGPDDPAPVLSPVLAAAEVPDGSDPNDPAVLPPQRAGDPWLLLYTAGGAIHLARSADGVTWTAASAPVLQPDASGDGDRLASPAAMWLRDAAGEPLRTVRLVYLGAGMLWAADAPLDALLADPPAAFERINAYGGDAAHRLPLLAPEAAPWLATIGRTTARSLRTPAGRARYDLFVSGTQDVGGKAVVGLASTYNPDGMLAATAPFLDVQSDRSPTVTVWGAGSLLLYGRTVSNHAVISAATSPP